MTDAFKLVQISQARRRQAATSVEHSMPTQQEIEELYKERITPETDLPPMQPLFEMFDVPCFYRGELVADCGKAKSGKTFFLSIVMAGCLTQKALALKRFCPTERTALELRSLATEGTQEITERASQAKSLALTDDTDYTDMKPLRVLWIDTEQSQQSTQEILRDRIIPLAENNSPAEIISPAERAEIAEMTSQAKGVSPTERTALELRSLATEGTQEITERDKSLTDSTDDTDSPSQREVSVISAISVGQKIDETVYAFNLRGLGYERRQRMVEVAVRAIKPDIVILDGIKDLMTDINDAVQATVIMEKLMALAKEMNCCIVCVLHQNKSEQDRNMRGSIGTELTNKAFEVFQCEIINENNGKTDTFKVTHTYSRKKKMKQNFYYCINDQGLPEWCPDYHEKPRDTHGRWISPKALAEDDEAPASEAELRKLFTNAMEGRNKRPFREVMAIALKRCGVADSTTYYRLLEQAGAMGIISMAYHPETQEKWIVYDDGSLPF